ncbi:MAG: DUF2752 domain-containing protein [Saprospiraceae bacterium]|nr:DUF2752 domain-containing protein [Pyrinomonadaceae bacterium]
MIAQVQIVESMLVRQIAAAGVLVASAAAGVVWYFNPANVNFLPVCPLYSMTGFACPGCGLTRGFHALFHGDVLAALDYNALIPVFAIILGFFFLSMLSVAVRGKQLPFSVLSPKILVGMLVLLLVFGVVRNLPHYPFSVLFP